MQRIHKSHPDFCNPIDVIQEHERKQRALESLLRQMSQPQHVSATTRLLVEAQPQSGPRNMAIDEALLESVANDGPAIFRLYTWSEATISLGYFQRETPEIEPGGRFQGMPAVRRLSGGGAILHHHELTYSCCVPGSHPLADEPSRLYDQMHQRIQAVLKECGIDVAPRGDVEGKENTFLCFARGDRRDLLCNSFKVVGSAQRRRGRAILQHGSILLRRSPFLPEHPGLFDLSQATCELDDLRIRLARHCSRLLGADPSPSTLSDEENARANDLEQARYSELMPDSDEIDE